MIDMHIAVAEAAKVALRGKIVARAQLGHGSILLIDFAEIGSSLATTYLRVECAWSLHDDLRVVAASEDSRIVILQHIAMLRDRLVRDVAVRIPSLQMQLQFDVGELDVFPVFGNNDDYENWTLHTPDGRALVAGPGRAARILPVDAPDV